MSIRLDDSKALAMNGGKRWAYQLNQTNTLFLYESPAHEPDKRFMLKLFRDGEELGPDYASTKAKAAERARHIHYDVCDARRTGESYQFIIRAIHERGIRQILALELIDYRGTWLSDDQKIQAGLASAYPRSELQR